MKRSAIYIYCFNSLVIHSIILFSLLMMPVSKGGTNAETFWGYIVYLKDGGEEAAIKSPATKSIQKPEGRNAGKDDRDDLLKKKEFEEKSKGDAENKKTMPSEKEAVKMAEVREKIAEKPSPQAPEIKEVRPEGKEVKKTEVPEAKKVSASLEVVKPPEIKEPVVEKSVPAPGKKEMKKTVDIAAEAEKVSKEPKSETKETKIAKAETHEVKEVTAEIKQKTDTIPEALPSKPDEKSSLEVPPMLDMTPWQNYVMSIPESRVSESVVTEVKESPPALVKPEVRSEKGEVEKEFRAKKIGKASSEGSKTSRKKTAKKRKTKIASKGDGGKKTSQAMPHAQAIAKAALSPSPKPAQEPAAPSLPEGMPAPAPGTGSSLSPVPSGIPETEGSAKQADLGLLPNNESEKKSNDAGKAELQVKEEAKGKEKESSPIRIPIPEALLLRDIEIEVYSGAAEMPGVLMRLMKKAYPSAREKKERGKQTVEMIDDRSETESEGRLKRVFSVTKAEKGVYTFIIENKGEKTVIEKLVFRLYGKDSRERIKEYSSVALPPNIVLKYHFILPDALFWDDEERFSGSIEDSNTITKFNYDSGLIWKEEKDH